LIVGSAKFLVSYWDSLSIALHGTAPPADAKGKAMVMDTSKKRSPSIPDGGNGDHTRKIWVWPPQGWAKVNTDTAFCEETGGASAGIVSRDSDDRVLLTA
jgi:hypothetical protein